ncbi:PH domain-containing protein, partial [Psychrobacter sp. CAL606-MNA-CIBAN-0158]
FVAIVLTIVGYSGHHSHEFFEFTWFATTMMMLAVYIRYKQWGYVLADKVIWQHSGFFGQQWKRVAFDKVQHVKITQTK